MRCRFYTKQRLVVIVYILYITEVPECGSSNVLEAVHFSLGVCIFDF